jgi:hypothetical protein
LRLRLVWIVLGLLVAGEAVHELFNFGGTSAFFDEWLPDTVVVVAAGICMARAAHERRGRLVWLAFGTGLACWSVGSVLWSVRYGNNPNPPYPTASDALWLLWYPFTGLGVALLIRLHVTRFELHRWIDGVAVMLIVLAGGFALVLESVVEHTGQGDFATIVDFSYPVLDMILVGAILGVFALMAWRPGKVWLWLGCGCVVMAAADAVFAVQEARAIASGPVCSRTTGAGRAGGLACDRAATGCPGARRVRAGLPAGGRSGGEHRGSPRDDRGAADRVAADRRFTAAGG